MERWFSNPKSTLSILIVCMVSAVVVLNTTASADEIITGNSPVLERVIKKGVLKVGVNPLFKPFSFGKDTGERVGIDIDIARLLAEKLGVKLEIVVPPSFPELFPMVLDGKIDIIMAAMSRIFDRSKWVDFTDAYYHTGISIMLNKVHGARLGVGSVKSYPELMRRLRVLGKENKLIIAATTGKSALESIPRFFPKATVKEYPTNEESAEAVAAGDAHIMVHDEIFLTTWVQENPDKALYKVVVFSEPYKPDTYGFAIAKENQSFLNMLNIFIDDQLYAQGYFERFMRAYIPAPNPAVKRDAGDSEL
jgi:ABC-type amino acid transport substrate-binding protein